MQYISEAGALTCVSKWKTCTAEMFVQHMHNYAAMYCDEHGNDGLSLKTYKMEARGGFATIYYASIKHPAIGTPVLMTITHPSGKTVNFETTQELPQRE